MSVFVVLSSCKPKPNMVNISLYVHMYTCTHVMHVRMYMHYMEKDNCEIRVLITPAVDLI